jgi:hypothetical protein
MTGGVAWNTQPPPLVCWSRKKPLLLANGNKTTNVLFEGTTDCVTACQLPNEKFVVDINCQFTKLLGHENRMVAGGTRDIESVGDAASAAHATANRHNERQKGLRQDTAGLERLI